MGKLLLNGLAVGFVFNKHNLHLPFHMIEKRVHDQKYIIRKYVI